MYNVHCTCSSASEAWFRIIMMPAGGIFSMQMVKHKGRLDFHMYLSITHYVASSTYHMCSEPGLACGWWCFMLNHHFLCRYSPNKRWHIDTVLTLLIKVSSVLMWMIPITKLLEFDRVANLITLHFHSLILWSISKPGNGQARGGKGYSVLQWNRSIN